MPSRKQRKTDKVSLREQSKACSEGDHSHPRSRNRAHGARRPGRRRDRSGSSSSSGGGGPSAAPAAPASHPPPARPRPRPSPPSAESPRTAAGSHEKSSPGRLSLPQSVLPTTPLLTTGLRLSTRTPDFDARARPRRQTQKPLRATAGVGRQREGDKVLGKLKESPEAMSSALPATVGRRGQISQPSVAGSELRE